MCWQHALFWNGSEDLYEKSNIVFRSDYSSGTVARVPEVCTKLFLSTQARLGTHVYTHRKAYGEGSIDN